MQGRVTLHGCASRNDVEGAKRLLQEGADVNEVSRYNRKFRQLLCTVLPSHVTIRCLSCNRRGDTPLLEAMSNHRADVAIFLLEHGADVVAKNKYANRQNGCVAVIASQACVSFHHEYRKGLNALHLAAINGNVEIVKALIKRHVDVDAPDNL